MLHLKETTLMIDFDKEDERLNLILALDPNYHEPAPHNKHLLYINPPHPTKAVEDFINEVNTLFYKCEYKDIDRAYQIASGVARRHHRGYLQTTINGIRDEALKTHLPFPDLDIDRPTITPIKKADNNTISTIKKWVISIINNDYFKLIVTGLFVLILGTLYLVKKGVIH